METNIVATVRKDTGSAESRRLRSSGSIPAIVYGLGMEPKSVYIDAREFNNALKTEAGSNVILNLSIGKKDTVTALPREIQSVNSNSSKELNLIYEYRGHESSQVWWPI